MKNNALIAIHNTLSVLLKRLQAARAFAKDPQVRQLKKDASKRFKL